MYTYICSLGSLPHPHPTFPGYHGALSWAPCAMRQLPTRCLSDTRQCIYGHVMRRADSLERPWCWEGLGAGVEGDDRGWDGWMASPTRWTWIWVDSESWWWTGRPGVLRFMGSQRVGHDWATELNWVYVYMSVLLSQFVPPFLLFLKYSFPLRFIKGYWIWFSVLYMKTLFFIHSVYESWNLLTPTSQFIPSLPPPPWQPPVCSLGMTVFKYSLRTIGHTATCMSLHSKSMFWHYWGWKRNNLIFLEKTEWKKC